MSCGRIFGATCLSLTPSAPWARLFAGNLRHKSEPFLALALLLSPELPMSAALRPGARGATARIQQAVGVLLMVAPMALACLPLRAANKTGTFNAMVTTFQNYGFEVVGNHPRCVQEPNLFGLYLRGTRRIVVCPRGNQLDTLMHEGWHAVQARCRKGKPLLTEQFLRANLSRADLRDIDALYSAKSWHREAEARAMAAQQIPLYMAHLDSSCGAPTAAGGIAQPPAGTQPSSPAVTAPQAAPQPAQPAPQANPMTNPMTKPVPPTSRTSMPGLLQQLGLPSIP